MRLQCESRGEEYSEDVARLSGAVPSPADAPLGLLASPPFYFHLSALRLAFSRGTLWTAVLSTLNSDS